MAVEIDRLKLSHADTSEDGDEPHDTETLAVPMFEDTDDGLEPVPQQSDQFAITFRTPMPAPSNRPSTAADWPPTPRTPAPRASAPLRERAFKRAAIYRVVPRPDTQ